MKEYIKQGFGLTIGLFIGAAAIKAFNEAFGGSKKKTDVETEKPEENVTVTDDVA